MNIILGDKIDLISDSYTVLELDTFQDPDTGKTVTAWCVIEIIPLGDFPLLDTYRTMHENLIKEYKLQNWESCISIIGNLIGRWNGDLDSFYENLSDRIEKFKQMPSQCWSPNILKSLR